MMKIEIDAPELPEGHELYTGDGVPPEPCYGLLGSMCWGMAGGSVVTSNVKPENPPKQLTANGVRAFANAQAKRERKRAKRLAS